jgi:uncharacterized membrane protein YfcA
MAVATNKFGALGVCTSAAYKFSKAKKINFKIAVPFVIISIMGAAIGANILLKTDQVLLSRVIGIMILLLIPAIFIKRDFGLKHVAKKNKPVGFLAYFFISIYDGFYGACSGFFAIYTFTLTLGYTIIESLALDKFALLFNTIIAVAFFAYGGIINYEFGVVMLLGMLVGGYLGAKTAIDKGNKYVKYAFAVVVFVSAVKLLFF